MKSIPVATELGRKDRFWPVVLASIAVHAAAIGGLALKRDEPTLDLDQVPLQAKLVRLGEKKPEQLLPQKESPPPDPAPTAPEPPPPAVTPPPPDAPPAPRAMPAPTPAPGPKPPAAQTRPGPPRSGTGRSIDQLLSDANKQVQRERWGDPNGDPEGDASEGSPGDRYEGLIYKTVRANYQVPSVIPEKDRLYLQAFMTIWVEPDGTISRFEITKSSGNAAFDAALERAIRATRLDPPPAEWERQFRRSGRVLNFKI